MTRGTDDVTSTADCVASAQCSEAKPLLLESHGMRTPSSPSQAASAASSPSTAVLIALVNVTS
jgi:hypothetical protein